MSEVFLELACFIFWGLYSVTLAQTTSSSLLEPPEILVPLNVSDFPYSNGYSDPLVLNFTRTPDILTYYGYNYTCYTVQSDDGYITTLYRINQWKNSSVNCPAREPCLIHHGLLSSSADLLIQNGDKNLPLMLVESCFDVWLVNGRGTTYSRGHVSLTPNDASYWDFSFDEMGKFDLPKQIDTVLTNSGNGDQKFTKLTYIGHSMGSSVFFICMHYHPEYSNKIRKYVAASPAAYVGNITSPPLVALAQAPDPSTEIVFKSATHGEFLNYQFHNISVRLFPVICSYETLASTFCSQFYYSIGGYSTNLKMNYTELSRAMSHFPDTASARTLTHFAQNVRSNKFQSQERYVITDEMKADAAKTTMDELLRPVLNLFCNAKNFTLASSVNRTINAIVGLLCTVFRGSTSASSTTTQTPLISIPAVDYKLNNTRMPMMAIVGAQDGLTSPQDVTRTVNELGTPSTLKQTIVLPNCNHLDIIVQTDCASRAYHTIRDYLAIDMPQGIQ